jgi:PleD family two-component response regulator
MKHKNITILVADDDTESLRSISSVLLAEGYKLALVSKGESIYKAIEENNIDLILLEIFLQGSSNGFEICKKLKSNEKTKDIPVVFLSARTNEEVIVEGFSTGGVDFITKPFYKEELLIRVRNQIKQKLLSEELSERIKYLEHSRSEFRKWLHSLANTIEDSK